MSDLTHRQACESVARWALRQPWCNIAVCEIAGRRIPPPNPMPPMVAMRCEWWRERTAWNRSYKSGGGQLDVLAFTAVGAKYPRPRIAVVEVKVSLSDLASDLKRGKMRRYEPQATHCYLGMTDSVWRDYQQRDDLCALPGWGILWIGRRDCGVQKQARATELDPTSELRAALTRRTAISLAHRALEISWRRDCALDEIADAAKRMQSCS